MFVCGFVRTVVKVFLLLLAFSSLVLCHANFRYVLK